MAHRSGGLVSLLVKPRIEIVSKDKLVASKGKLITVTGEPVFKMRLSVAAAGGPGGNKGHADGGQGCADHRSHVGTACTACATCRSDGSIVATTLPTASTCVVLAETFGEIPNGSAWAITTQAAPDLDETHLVVGRVVQVWPFVCDVPCLPSNG